MLSIFSMPSTGSAPTRTGSVLVPLAGRVTSQWSDLPGGTTLLKITHPDQLAELLSIEVAAAHPKVRLVEQTSLQGV